MDRSVKLLLTLLVLLGGLAVSPAQARPCFGADARVEQVAGDHAATASAAAASYRDTVIADRGRERPETDRWSLEWRGPVVPAVLVSDRALE